MALWSNKQAQSRPSDMGVYKEGKTDGSQCFMTFATQHTVPQVNHLLSGIHTLLKV